jgi:hypothetical protein
MGGEKDPPAEPAALEEGLATDELPINNPFN